MHGLLDPLLEARLDMSLDDILKRPSGGGSFRGRGRRSVASSKPYERPSFKSSQAPLPVSLFLHFLHFLFDISKVDFNSVTNRLYVNNLSYETSWQTLKDHMRTAGNVVRAEIISDQSGRSKVCNKLMSRLCLTNIRDAGIVILFGFSVLLVQNCWKCLDFLISIVEFETRQDAIRAIKTLNDSELEGRLIYLREVHLPII